MKTRTLIVEDEPRSRERLREVLSRFPELELVGEAADGVTAVRLIDDLAPELLFLDIQVPGMDGFEILATARRRPMVVFVTAYDRFTLRAFEESAVDYVLKPWSEERIGKAVRKALEIGRPLDDRIVDRLREMISRRSYMRLFPVRSGEELLIVPDSEVYYFKADEKVVLLCTYDRELPFDMALKDLEQELDPELFCRIHKSHIVALSKIKKLGKWFNREYVIRLGDKAGTSLRLGRSYQAAFRERLHI